MKSLSEVNFDKYEPLVIGDDLKQTSQKALYKFWMETCERLGLQYKFDADGYLLDMDTLGKGFIVENLQWAGALPDDWEEGELMTLGELAESREFETNLFQFQVNPNIVEKLLVDREHGLLKNAKLYTPISVVYRPNSDQAIIGGGRHRLVALLTMFKVIRGYENFVIYVNKNYAKSNSDLAVYVELNNKSRTMTATEVSMLDSAAKGEGLTIFSTPEEFYKRARKFTQTADLKDLARRLWVALAENTVLESSTTTNAIGDLGYSFTSKFCRQLNAVYGRGADKCLLLVDDETQVFEAVTTSAFETLINNWHAYCQEIRVPVRGRDGTLKTDEEGQTMFNLNISRSVNQLAQMLCEVMMESVGEQLGTIVEAERQKDAQKKQQAKENNKAKAIERSIATLQNSIEQFERLNMVVPDTFRQQIEQKRAELRQELAASPVVEKLPQADTTDELRDLLG